MAIDSAKVLGLPIDVRFMILRKLKTVQMLLQSLKLIILNLPMR
jgi:hypothetical protein